MKVKGNGNSMIFGILAVLCLAYCVVIFSAQSGSRFYLIWAVLGLFFLGMFCMVQFGWWQALPVWLRGVVRIGVSIGLVFFLLVEGMIFSQYHAKGEDNLDYIIVLGAQMKEDGPSKVLQYRLDTAYEYLLANEDTICIVSGGQGSNEVCSEAEGMYRYLVQKGIPTERIRKEEASTDTSENIRYSAQIIGDKAARVGIVTNNFHVFRGVHLAKHAGFEKVCGIAAPSTLLFQPNNLLREFFGVLKDFVCGNLI